MKTANFDPKEILSELLVQREPSDSELDDQIMLAILRELRHGSPMQKLPRDCFGLARMDSFTCFIQNGFPKTECPRFQERFHHCIEVLIALEKIEIRGKKIRALYGHSLPGVIVGEMKWPNSHLFHATQKRHLNSIFKHGLRPQGRTWVHLTTSPKYASEILTNHSYQGRPVLLRIIPELLESHDITFRKPNSHVWLANRIPSVAIKVSEPNGHSEIDLQAVENAMN